MELFIVRHGETLHNARFTHHRHHTPLSPKGEAQANALASAISSYGISRIETSTASRAMQTATIVGATLNLPITFHEDLREERRPSVLADLSYFHPRSLYVASLLLLFGGSHMHYSDEENPYEFRARTAEALARIEASATSEEKLLIIAHNAIILEMTDILKGNTFVPFFRRPLTVISELVHCGGFHATQTTKGEWAVETFVPLHKSFFS